MRLFKTCLIAFVIIVSSAGCKKFLEYEPKGALSSEDIDSPEKVEGLVTAAYAGLGNDNFTGPITSMWGYGSVRSDDAHKGGGGIGDMTTYNSDEQYNLTTPENNNDIIGFPTTWKTAFDALSRINFALRAVNNVDESVYAEKAVRQGELRFLRGHINFLLKILFKNIPFIDENLTDEEIAEVRNDVYSNDESWNKIAEDFIFAVEQLPLTQTQVGRANQLAAKAYLAKVRLYQAYEQDAQHNVTGINQDRLNEVVTLTSDVINAGVYSLNDDFAKNFLFGYDNGPESIFAIQYSVNDGTEIGRLNMATGVNYSLAPQYGCCGFHVPTQNLVNAFKTDANGVPMFDTFDDVDMVEPDGFLTNGVDPRLDHTVAIQGHPFKYRPDVLYDHSWERLAAVYGGYGNMKEQQSGDCSCFKKIGPFYGTSVNTDIIRYADVLLFKAEALIELGRQDEALPLINMLRERAANSTGMLKLQNGNFPSNYRIDEYEPGTNITWSQENARKALRFERRLEFAMESPRFFDLVRWGVAAEVLNVYLSKDKLRRSFLQNAQFIKNQNEYFPIPQREIDFTKGAYVQNPGY